jgi:hypothetical protein
MQARAIVAVCRWFDVYSRKTHGCSADAVFEVARNSATHVSERSRPRTRFAPWTPFHRFSSPFIAPTTRWIKQQGQDKSEAVPVLASVRQQGAHKQHSTTYTFTY